MHDRPYRCTVHARRRSCTWRGSSGYCSYFPCCRTSRRHTSTWCRSRLPRGRGPGSVRCTVRIHVVALDSVDSLFVLTNTFAVGVPRLCGTVGAIRRPKARLSGEDASVHGQWARRVRRELVRGRRAPCIWLGRESCRWSCRARRSTARARPTSSRAGRRSRRGRYASRCTTASRCPSWTARSRRCRQRGHVYAGALPPSLTIPIREGSWAISPCMVVIRVHQGRARLEALEFYGPFSHSIKGRRAKGL